MKDKDLKIGLIGNLNNNNFSLLRYLRDLGFDAHLLLYKNDGRDGMEHFAIDCDTWRVDQWLPYIQRMPFSNEPLAAAPLLFATLGAVRGVIRYWMGVQREWSMPVTTGALKKEFDPFTILIGSGIAPALLKRIDRSLDIYYPYSPEIEFYKAGWFLRQIHKATWISGKVLKLIQRRQALGIQAAKIVLNSEPGPTQQHFVDLAVKPVTLAIPMVYVEPEPRIEQRSTMLNQVLENISTRSEFKIMHHSRLMWSNDEQMPDGEWQKENKNSDWLFRAVAKIKEQKLRREIRIYLVAYGPDVNATMGLIEALGISDSVQVLPKMPRKEILVLMKQMDLACGEFYSPEKRIWGGTGWEAMASGTALLQGFNFEDGEFESIFGYPDPPLLKVRNQEELEGHLIRCLNCEFDFEQAGKESQKWFMENNGQGLARRWIETLSSCQS